MTKKKIPPSYLCPACGKLFIAKERVKKACPHCLVVLKSVQTKTEGKRGFHYHFIIADPDQPEATDLHKEQMAPPVKGEIEGDLVTDPGENPAIYLLDDGQQAGDESQRRVGRKYLMRYVNRIYTGWIYCPGCYNKLFQNTAVQSGPFGHEHMCRNRKCKALVRVVFMLEAPTEMQHEIFMT